MKDYKMMVTDKNYYMEARLIRKLDMMCDRVTAKHPVRDCLLLIEGAEGEGKTTLSVDCAYYISWKTKRKFGNENIFFDAWKMLEFAQQTEQQIIIWDEPALAGLSAEWWKQSQLNIIKLLMIARKKQHFFIFNITRFDKFKDVIIERALGMARVYAPKQIKIGKFIYYNKKSLNNLYTNWKKKKIRNYKKYYSFRGAFKDMLAEIIDEKAYNKAKDEAIMSIGKSKEKKDNPDTIKLGEMEWKQGHLKFPIKTKKNYAEQMGFNVRNLFFWEKGERGAIKPQKDTAN